MSKIYSLDKESTIYFRYQCLRARGLTVLGMSVKKKTENIIHVGFNQITSTE